MRCPLLANTFGVKGYHLSLNPTFLVCLRKLTAFYKLWPTGVENTTEICKKDSNKWQDIPGSWIED